MIYLRVGDTVGITLEDGSSTEAVVKDIVPEYDDGGPTGKWTIVFEEESLMEEPSGL